MNRHRTWTVALTSESIGIEARPAMSAMSASPSTWTGSLRRVNDGSPLPAVTRLGLRYIDEIEVERVDELQDWRPWIREELLAGGLVEGFHTRDYLATVTLDVDPTRRLTVRYGRVSQPVVEPNGPLRITDSPVGPYSSWTSTASREPSTDEYLEFDAEEVLKVCLALHEPVRHVFDARDHSSAPRAFDFSKESQA